MSNATRLLCTTRDDAWALAVDLAEAGATGITVDVGRCRVNVGGFPSLAAFAEVVAAHGMTASYSAGTGWQFERRVPVREGSENE